MFSWLMDPLVWRNSKSLNSKSLNLIDHCNHRATAAQPTYDLLQTQNRLVQKVRDNGILRMRYFIRVVQALQHLVVFIQAMFTHYFLFLFFF